MKGGESSSSLNVNFSHFRFRFTAEEEKDELHVTADIRSYKLDLISISLRTVLKWPLHSCLHSPWDVGASLYHHTVLYFHWCVSWDDNDF